MLGAFDIITNLVSTKKIVNLFLSPSSIPKISDILNIKDTLSYFTLDSLVQGFNETGVLHYMATKPDTLTSALVDSPVGTAAHILEKYSTFVNTENRNLDDGGLLQKFTMDELINVVMIYWTSGNIGSTARIYKELLGVNSGVMK